MTGNSGSIDQFLAAVIRGQDAGWPVEWTQNGDSRRVVERIYYHGIAGLIADKARRLGDWPAAVLTPVREQAIALAMWEMRHKAVLDPVLAAFASQNILALLLKGTALAYDLYPNPAARARGDSDLLVPAADLNAARSILTNAGFRCQTGDQTSADEFALQEVWSLKWDGETEHHIDLHWQLLNAPALRGVLDFSECSSQPVVLRKLHANARAMNRVLNLIHTCVHRAMHITSPYFVEGVTYFGGDRLIWAMDIHLLAGALSKAEWMRFCALAKAQGVATVCLDGLKIARGTLGTKVSDWVVLELGDIRREPASDYLLESRQVGRAWKDLSAIPGWRGKLAYIGSRALPSRSFVRGKYPTMTRWPLGFLYGRRIIDLVRPRTGRSQG